MKQKPLIIGIVIALAIAGGAYAYFNISFTPSSVFPMKCAYDDCPWTGNVELQLGQDYPPKCPKCGRNSALPVSKCPKCGNLQVANERMRGVVAGMENIPPTTKCKKCGTRIMQGN